MTKEFECDIFIAYHGDDITGSAREANRLYTILKMCFPEINVYCQDPDPKLKFVSTPKVIEKTKYFILVAKPSIPVDRNKRVLERNDKEEKKYLYEEIETFYMKVARNTSEENIAKVVYVEKGPGIVSFDDLKDLYGLLFESENYHYEEIDNFEKEIKDYSIEEIKSLLVSSDFYKNWLKNKFPNICVDKPKKKSINRVKRRNSNEKMPDEINISQLPYIFNIFDDNFIDKEDLIIDDTFVYTNKNRIKGIKELGKNGDKILINKEIRYVNQDIFNKIYRYDVIYDGTIEDWCKIQFNNYYSNPMFSMCDSNSFYLSHDNKYFKLINLDLLNVNEIKNYSFINLSYENLIINKNTKIYEESFNRCHFNNIYFNGTLSDWLNMNFENERCNPLFFSDNLYILDECNKFVLFPKFLIIPNDIKEIKPYTLTNLCIIHIDFNNVENILSYAFYLSKNLYKIKIDNRIKSIDELAFNESSLEEILNQSFVKIKNNDINIIKKEEDSSFIYRNDFIYKVDKENNTSTIKFYYGKDTNIFLNKTISYNKKTYNIINVDYNAFANHTEFDSITFNANLNNYDFLKFIDVSKIIICINKPETILDNIKNLICDNIEVLDDDGEIIDDKKRRFHKVRFSVDDLTDIRDYEKKVIKEVTLKECEVNYSFLGFSSLRIINVSKNVKKFYKFSLNDNYDYSYFNYNGEKIDLYYEGSIEEWIQINFNKEGTPLIFADSFYYKNNNENVKLVDLDIDSPNSQISKYSFFGYKNFRKIFINRISKIGFDAFCKCNYKYFILNQFSGCFFVDKDKELFIMSDLKDKKYFKNYIIYRYREKKPLINKNKYWHLNDKNEPEKW